MLALTMVATTLNVRKPEIRVFLDANVLFSAAWHPDAGLQRLWNVADVALLASAYVQEEARRNLPDETRRERLRRLVEHVATVPERPDIALPAEIEPVEKDRPVLQAAIGAGSAWLLTGDVRDCGPLMGITVQGVQIQRPAVFLRRCPPT